MLYMIQATIQTRKDDWALAIQVPTFFLSSEVQGITNRQHAERIAKTILNPFGDENITVECVVGEVEE